MNKVNYVVSAAGGYLIGLLGGVDQQLRALILIMVLDFISGFLAACVGKSTKTQSGYLSSKAAGAGVVKKIAYLICVIVAVLLEETTGLTFIREIVIISFVVTETLSVLENCSRLGIKPPKVIYNVLDVLKKKTEEKDDGQDQAG
jgi:toxin secretion/phage lysis holin